MSVAAPFSTFSDADQRVERHRQTVVIGILVFRVRFHWFLQNEGAESKVVPLEASLSGRWATVALPWEQLVPLPQRRQRPSTNSPSWQRRLWDCDLVRCAGDVLGSFGNRFRNANSRFHFRLIEIHWKSRNVTLLPWYSPCSTSDNMPQSRCYLMSGCPWQTGHWKWCLSGNPPLICKFRWCVHLIDPSPKVSWVSRFCPV